MYDLEGTNFTILDTASSMINAVRVFQNTRRDFIGVKLIYAPSRDYNDSRIDQYLENARLLKVVFNPFPPSNQKLQTLAQ